MQILQFQTKPATHRPRNCAGCRTPLAAAPAWWTLCARCHRYHQFGAALREFNRLDLGYALRGPQA